MIYFPLWHLIEFKEMAKKYSATYIFHECSVFFHSIQIESTISHDLRHRTQDVMNSTHLWLQVFFFGSGTSVIRIAEVTLIFIIVFIRVSQLLIIMDHAKGTSNRWPIYSHPLDDANILHIQCHSNCQFSTALIIAHSSTTAYACSCHTMLSHT